MSQLIFGSKIYSSATEPSILTDNKFWFNTDNKNLYYCTDVAWNEIKTNVNNVTILSSNNVIPLSEYLNTQFSIIGDGLDYLDLNKQNNLNYYYENVSSKYAYINIDRNNISNSEIYINGSQILYTSYSVLSSTGLVKIKTGELNGAKCASISLCSIQRDNDEQIYTGGQIVLDGHATNNNYPANITISGNNDLDGGEIIIKGGICDSNTTKKGNIIIQNGHNLSRYGDIYIGQYDDNYKLGTIFINGFVQTDNITLSTTNKTLVPAINEIFDDYQTLSSIKQNKNINLQGITATTIEGALTELNNKMDPVNNLDSFIIQPTSTSNGISITSNTIIANQSKSGNVIITPSINNVGAIYVGTSASSKPTSLPIYPDTVVQYSDSNLDNLFIFVDSIGDSCGVQISYND